MRRAEAGRRCALDPRRALALWADTRRWPAFVEGFATVAERDAHWPEPGSRLVWTSIPSGRGRVSEEVLEYDPSWRLVTRVEEEALTGTQTLRLVPEGEGSVAHLELEYELPAPTLGGRLADRLFIRRALRDAQARTLGRFCAEADEEALVAE